MSKSFITAQALGEYIDTKIDGSFLNSDIDFLGSYVRKLKLGDVYWEIGCQYGKSLASAVWQSPEGVNFFTLDIDDLPAPAPDKLSRQEFFETEGLDKICVFIQGESTKVAKRCSEGSISMIFLDATHTYEAGRADILAWTPKLKSGGFMVFHDYSDSQFTLAPAINEFVRDSGQFTDFKVAKELGYVNSSMAGAIKK